MGAKEFISGNNRICLWLNEKNIEIASKILGSKAVLKLLETLE